MKPNALIFYSRLPTPDLVGKTRIGTQINNQPLANELAQSLILDALQEYTPNHTDTYDMIWYYQGNLDKYIKPSNITTYIPQISTTISMDYIHKKIANAYHHCIIVGSDLPLITKHTLQQSFDTLTTNNVVISPTEDHGYGLIGTDNYYDLYTHITNWESRSPQYDLMKETLSLTKQRHLTVHLNPTVFDIDHVSDIKHLWQTITTNGNLKPNMAYLKHTYNTIKQNRNVFVSADYE
ncbi:MAG: DUF2064 domain-containing protein [Candidatus Magasanikbacteria bacterium]|uniref:Glycosyltransferase n=1 Tax=Candidatus Magasanikbacteria bacterium CG10_big_fil_rev_8_21_14_0_10_38_6 TaxID=1974647 RepID=A0A2M6P1M1_9BACT|nr:DUF2064 domain-containing protein [Candidatus Magasanikbacteria bacterium]NCS72079.1 DUF2064 domain-containing protein [Candidatus Magasanikbacteria bacterium]PIR77320.1 MAG: hypothetical protein COU30_03090 [Candidatus Magasanikbacteria bacterium CG10_big_fil_rev_8_21_14_0_10_38_6]